MKALTRSQAVQLSDELDSLDEQLVLISELLKSVGEPEILDSDTAQAIGRFLSANLDRRTLVECFFLGKHADDLPIEDAVVESELLRLRLKYGKAEGDDR